MTKDERRVSMGTSSHLQKYSVYIVPDYHLVFRDDLLVQGYADNIVIIVKQQIRFNSINS